MTIVKNKKAYFNYEIIDSWEAGIELFGHEVKSVRAWQVNLKWSFVVEVSGQLFIRGMHISAWKWLWNKTAIEVDRERKLMLHKKTIVLLSSKMKEKWLSVVPLELYFKWGLLKIKVWLARWKKKFEKKQILKERSIDKEAKMMLKKNY